MQVFSILIYSFSVTATTFPWQSASSRLAPLTHWQSASSDLAAITGNDTGVHEC